MMFFEWARMEVIVKEIGQRQPENMDEIVFRLPLGV
jgi:hypothetical protein